MTAEIVVLNREAVALAADSAVTSHVGEIEKISTSANKLFRMSDQYPVGLMIYGNALFMDVPWETVIKVYGKTKLPKKGFNSLNEYAKDFISFLRYENIRFTDAAEDNYILTFVESLIVAISKEVAKRVQENIRQKGQDFKKSMIADIAQEVIQEHTELHRNQENYIPLSHARTVMRKYKKYIDKGIQRFISSFNLDATLSTAIRQIILYSFARSFSDDIYTGVVIAGFGEKEFFPTVQAYKIEGITQCKLKGQLKEVLKCVWDEEHSLEDAIAGVISFAQVEMIHRFMEGVDPNYRYSEESFLSDLCSDFVGKFVNQLLLYDDAKRVKIKQKLEKYSASLIAEFSSNMSDFMKRYFSDPFLDYLRMNWQPWLKLLSI